VFGGQRVQLSAQRALALARGEHRQRLADEPARLTHLQERRGRAVRLAHRAVRVGDEVGVGREVEQLPIAGALALDRLARAHDLLALQAQLLLGDLQLFEARLEVGNRVAQQLLALERPLHRAPLERVGAPLQQHGAPAHVLHLARKLADGDLAVGAPSGH
jgi:hypothetical protein